MLPEYGSVSVSSVSSITGSSGSVGAVVSGIVVSGTPAIYKDGIVAKAIEDDFIYYITEDKTEKLTDDSVAEFCGIYDGFVYYTVK